MVFQRLVWIFSVVGLCICPACLTPSERAAARKTGGNPRQGIVAIRHYGCAACHTIPGIKGAIGRTGPSLSGIARRAQIAEGLNNTPENLIRWIQDPRSINRYTNMPTVAISAREARDIAAYLYTLK